MNYRSNMWYNWCLCY